MPFRATVSTSGMIFTATAACDRLGQASNTRYSSLRRKGIGSVMRTIKPYGILLSHIDAGAHMSASLEQLQSQVLELPAEDRARLLELLLASFEPKSDAQEAWINEAVRRRNEVRSGTVSMVPGDEALARIRAKLA